MPSQTKPHWRAQVRRYQSRGANKMFANRFSPTATTALAMVAVLATGLTACSDGNGDLPADKQLPSTEVPATTLKALSGLAKITSVDQRYQSFNIEMVEITGGRFWAPYDAEAQQPEISDAKAPDVGVAGDGTVLGLDAKKVFRYRAPLDLTNPRLRELAGALAPAYMRVSGSWANSTYFHASDEPAPTEPPAGYAGILTLAQWQEVLNFSKSLDLDILLSFAISDGTRDVHGVWRPEQARALFDATAAAGGKIAAVEFMNETTMGRMQGLPADYSAEDYARDFQRFKTLVGEISPDTIIAGPSAVGENSSFGSKFLDNPITTEDIYKFTGPTVDAMSYHYYGGLSLRCARSVGLPLPQVSQALAPKWLAGTSDAADFYGELRDRLEPDKPLWLTETAETACGGNPWASTFVDSFRYVDQLGRLAVRSVQTVMHNTLVASDYAMIDEDTLEPRPNYWAALLWRRLMGPVVLDAGEPSNPYTYVYAHCLRGTPGGVAVVALNTHREATSQLVVADIAQRYTLSAEGSLETQTILLNGEPLMLDDGAGLPELAGKSVETDSIELEPASITFLSAPTAGNAACGALAES